MGWERMELEYVARVSRHNSNRDKVDDALWADFCERVKKIAEEDKYKHIMLMEV